MTRRTKRAAALVLKIAILAGILEYTRRQSQIADELVVPEPVALTTTDGRAVTLPAATRLTVESDANAPRAYPVVASDGSHFDIPAVDVEGPSPRFTLRPGMRTLFRQLDYHYLVLAFLMFGPPLFLMAVRWRLLLVASDANIPFFTLIRLHYMAFFFNTFMPGGAGGDIIKAVYVTRHSAQKAEAATMVLIDRVIGLVGLLIMAGAVVLADYREMHGIAAQVGVISLVLAVGAVLFFSARFRALIRYETLVGKLPAADTIRKIDAALLGLGRKKRWLLAALLLTLVLQFLEIVGVSLAGRAIGLHKPTLAHYLAFVPIGYLFNALPISFGGIGLMEGAYLKLFRDAGVATATQGFTLGLIARLIVVGWSLLGALSALFPPEKNDLPMTAAAAPSSRSEG